MEQEREKRRFCTSSFSRITGTCTIANTTSATYSPIGSKAFSLYFQLMMKEKNWREAEYRVAIYMYFVCVCEYNNTPFNSLFSEKKERQEGKRGTKGEHLRGRKRENKRELCTFPEYVVVRERERGRERAVGLLV